jgi:hypothetical protein
VELREAFEKSARKLRVKLRPLRHKTVVRHTYQNVRYAWFTARNGLWRLLRSRRNRGSERTLTVNTYRVPLTDGALRGDRLAQVEQALTSLGVDIRPGHHTVYVPPGAAGVGALSTELEADYPPTAGLKFLRDPGTVDTAHYLTQGSNSAVRNALTGTPRDQALAANLLHVLELGPRVWDVVNVQFETDERTLDATAFVIDHIEGEPPTQEACEDFLTSVEKALAESPLDLTMPGWRRKPDFTCPGCNGNLLTTADGALRYVDFQNFVADRAQWLEELATRGSTTHFGRDVPQRGGRYLYQAIPGVDAPAKRNPEQRWDTIAAALTSAGVSLDGRLVIDVGCNAGVMSHYALTGGAHWVVALDKPDIADYAGELLLALGSSRHTIVPGMLGNDTDLPAMVPEFLRPRLAGSVVLYLAVRDTMGIMGSLETFDWRAIVYEGHQGETLGESQQYLAGLLEATGAEIVLSTKYTDGDSTARSLLLLVRPGSP